MLKLKQVPEDFIVREVHKLSLSENGPYFYYKLAKRNLTTEEAIAQLCKKFRIPRNRVGSAGIKDKRAVTEQFISLPKEVRMRGKQMSLEYLGRGAEPISLGSHDGNDFAITVRSLSDEEMLAFKKNAKKRYFLNLFDGQRFSSRNERAGEFIVKGDFKKAAGLMLEGSGLQEQRMRESLKMHPNDFVGALRSLPRKVCLIYIHSFQAGLWNIVAEKMRNEKNAAIPLVGFATEFKNEKAKAHYESLLRQKNISLREFVIKKIPELSSEGGERRLYARIERLTAAPAMPDELNPGMKKIEVSFHLGKGCYATMAIKELFSQSRKAAP